MKYLAYLILGVAFGLSVTGCATVAPWSDWQRFSAANGDAACASYEAEERARCLADRAVYEKTVRACKHSAEAFGADYAGCMNRNKALWNLYPENFEYQALRYNGYVSADHYRELPNYWDPLCFNASGEEVDCE